MARNTQRSIGRVDDFDLYTLRSDAVELTVAPGMGAKITSLKSLRSGREWMWRAFDPPRYFLNSLEDGFAQSPLIGVDECLPSIGACAWQGRQIPDHGEAWSRAWELDEEAWARGAILTRLDLPLSPFRFERSIRLEGGDIQLDYRLTNRGRNAEMYLWAIHPLFTIEPGDRIELPDAVRSTRLGAAGGFPAEMPADSWAWPEPAPGLRLDELDRFGDGRCAKLFVDAVDDGYAAVYNPARGERLSLHWDTAENPALGIWICTGIWNGYYQMALEPTNAGAEALDEAAERPDAFKPVPAGSVVRWQLRLRLEQAERG
jgi:galactose mutarotase-like enzyme